MKERLTALETEAINRVSAVERLADLETLRVHYLGRKGAITGCLREMGRMKPEERPEIGQIANRVKASIENLLDSREVEINKKESENRLAGESVDITLPGRRIRAGSLHPLTIIQREILDIFVRMGFEVAEGPEVEKEYYNFEALNFPADHPARDMQDTFYIAPGVLLRTHTSPVQVRAMEKKSPPVRIIAPGKVYRCDSDVTHSPMFHQVEGLLVDEGVSFADLKGLLTRFLHLLFGPDKAVRLRPSFFPFTEPSAEIDIECVMCGGSGCRVCSQTGWLEILGAGMVDPALYKYVNYDPERYQGFAFGLGIERIAMLKYGIGDIRYFYENDISFLSQFS